MYVFLTFCAVFPFNLPSCASFRCPTTVYCSETCRNADRDRQHQVLCLGNKSPCQVWAWQHIEASAASDHCTQRLLPAAQVVARVLQRYRATIGSAASSSASSASSVLPTAPVPLVKAAVVSPVMVAIEDIETQVLAATDLEALPPLLARYECWPSGQEMSCW